MKYTGVFKMFLKVNSCLFDVCDFFQTVSRHFKTIPVVEKEVLTFFIYMAKSYKSRFDSKHMEASSS